MLIPNGVPYRGVPLIILWVVYSNFLPENAFTHCKQAHKQQVDVPQQSVQADDGHMFTAEDGQLGEMCSKMMKCMYYIYKSSCVLLLQ